MSKFPLAPLGAALFGLFASFSAAAQTAAPADTAHHYRHEFGLTASPVLDHFFTANRSLPVGLFYKRQLTHNRSLRLRLVGRYLSTDSSNFADIKPGTGNWAWQVLGYVGYEWQRPLGHRVQLYYGAEVGSGMGRNVRRSVRDWYNSQGPFNEDVSYTIRTWQAQARPFLGFRFQLGTYGALFVETSVPVTYAYQREGYTGYFNQGAFSSPSIFTHNTYSGETTAGKLSIALLAIDLIGFNYRF
ncbi:hypothetical protein [Hymenobacter rubidus]|uniref:hypothetical protein n=1 Tax=Hymenobacter rubidus TaxID=1441626 RepID=UPI00191D6ECD|nr:hypothetical protein [Hymenobacter rubidus]